MLGSAAASGRIDYSLALGAVVFLYRLFVGVPSQERSRHEVAFPPMVRVYLSGLRAPCMPRHCLRRLETRHPYHLGGVFWYGSSISILIQLSLIRGIYSVADGENI